MVQQKVLILEDDVMLAELFALTLRNASCEAIVCTSFEEARSQLRSFKPDALLTDVRLGDYNGLQAAILFRSQMPDGPIVVVSGHGDRVIEREASMLGAQFLVKPLDLGKLPNLLGC